LGDEQKSSIPQAEITASERHIPEAISALRDIANRVDALANEQKAEKQKTTCFQRESLSVQWLLFWATALAFVAAAVYAGIARYELRETQKQTAIADEQSRPWIKVMEVTLNNPETLSFNKFSNGGMMLAPGETLTLFAPAKATVASANIRTQFHFKNIGKSVAREIRINAELFFMPNPSDFYTVRKEQDRFCGQGESYMRAAMYSRSALFPDDEFAALINATGWVYNEDVSKRENLDWVDPVLIACIAYQRPRNFETRIAYSVANLKSRGIKLGAAMSSEQMRFIRDEHYEYAQ